MHSGSTFSKQSAKASTVSSSGNQPPHGHRYRFDDDIVCEPALFLSDRRLASMADRLISIEVDWDIEITKAILLKQRLRRFPSGAGYTSVDGDTIEFDDGANSLVDEHSRSPPLHTSSAGNRSRSIVQLVWRCKIDARRRVTPGRI